MDVNQNVSVNIIQVPTCWRIDGDRLNAACVNQAIPPFARLVQAKALSALGYFSNVQFVVLYLYHFSLNPALRRLRTAFIITRITRFCAQILRTSNADNHQFVVNIFKVYKSTYVCAIRFIVVCLL